MGKDGRSRVALKVTHIPVYPNKGPHSGLVEIFFGTSFDLDFSSNFRATVPNHAKKASGQSIRAEYSLVVQQQL